ncbi:MAG: prepilin peptidase [Alphaproteobacteria bacterium]|nr:prepilin peptidase [Alphaproteobacteria bacterium]MCL2505062.1 prepilin peptidase [Alphaproteobacteria bacterium]
MQLLDDTLLFRFLFGFVIGAILGSFSTMLVYRIPNRISVVFPRSRCTECKTVLGVRDLVPIFSWLCNKGRCRHCKKPISSRYLYIELVVSLACAVVTCLVGFSLLLIPFYIAVVAGVVCFSIKLRI